MLSIVTLSDWLALPRHKYECMHVLKASFTLTYFQNRGHSWTTSVLQQH